MTKAQWIAFPHPSKAFAYAREALKKNWARLHRGDCEPYPKEPRVQEAWRLFHQGKFAEAVALGLEAGGAGVTAANKAQAIYANGVEPKEGAKTIPGRPEMVLASMGNYIFKASVMTDVLQRNALRDAAHDFGKEIIPAMYPRMKVHAYDFAQNFIPGEADLNRGYWRDVGTIDSYFAACLDLVSVTPMFNLYNMQWPIVSAPMNLPPAKFVFADAQTQRIGIATDSMVSDGVIISGGTINRSVLHPRVRVHSYTDIDESILMDGVDVGRHSKIRRAIIDKGVKIPTGTTIGYDVEADRQRFTVTDTGIVVVPKGAEIEEKVMA